MDKLEDLFEKSMTIEQFKEFQNKYYYVNKDYSTNIYNDASLDYENKSN